MSEPNLKAMTQSELLKYLEEDFMPRLLPKLANVKNIEAENTRLKAETERLTANTDKLCKHGDLEIERLKAEVKRLGIERISDLGMLSEKCAETAALKAEVERLTKAHSDALADFWAIHKGYFDLKADVEQLRKEGKQP